MSGIGAAIVGGSALTGLIAASAQKDAARQASDAQLAANRDALGFQNQQFGQALDFQNNQLGRGDALAGQQQAKLQALFAPFLAAGNQAVGGLGALGAGGAKAFNQQLGLSGALGADAQTQAIAGIEGSPIFQALARQGEDAILANASATGGLRGGNTQAALAQYQPALLNSLIQQQFTNLGTLSSLGAGALGNVAGLGGQLAGTQAQVGSSILGNQLGLGGQIAGNVASLMGTNAARGADLIGQRGSIQAGNFLAQGGADANFWNQLGSAGRLAALLPSGGASPAGTPPVSSTLGDFEGRSLLSALGRNFQGWRGF